jgi:hypothetical protein|tara:strand:- start:61 stop:243 length:183 start_codon:yes stop_codon:yes gene_type:complete
MSVTKKIDHVAQGVADHIKEIIYDTVEWQIADFPVNGDEYNAIHSAVMKRAIEYLYDDTN